MAAIYTALIVKGLKGIGDVPAGVKTQVEQMLRDIDCGYLIEG